MKLTYLSAIAAITLSLAAGSAFAASSNDDGQGTTNTQLNSTAPTSPSPITTSNGDGTGTTNSATQQMTVGTAMNGGSTSEARGTFFTGLAPADQASVRASCKTGMDSKKLSAEEMSFCKSIAK